MIVAYAIDLMPAPFRKSILRRRYDDLLAHAFDALRGKLRYAITHDLEPWRRSAHVTIASAVENVRRAVLSAFDKIETDGDASEQRESQRVTQLQRELLDIRAGLEGGYLWLAEPAAKADLGSTVVS